MPLSKLVGRNLMLCNMVYQGPLKSTDWHDYLSIVYRDLDTGKKEIMTIEDPTYTIYIVKPEFRTFRKPRHFLLLDQLDPKVIKYKNRYREIAKIAGPQYEKLLKDPTFDKRYLMKYPYVLGADIDIETVYRTMWAELLSNDSQKQPDTAFLDIEVDTIDINGFPHDGEAPINAITIIHEKERISYTFLLDNGKNPLIPEFVNNISNFQKELHEMFDEKYGYYEYKIYMFTDEVELIKASFQLINVIRPDMCGIWNMSFDIPYIIDRLKVLNIDPATIMTHSDFPYPTCNYYVDRNSKDFRDKKDFFSDASYTHYRCQQRTYQGLRKSQGTIRRTNLDAIGFKEIGYKKLDYHKFASIKTLPYEDYNAFVMYNINDVLLQCGIDNKCHDMMNIYLSALSSYVPYKDVQKQTVALRGLMYHDFLVKKGIVLGNNANFDNSEESSNDDNDEEEDGYEGAINGDPMLNAKVGANLFGVPSQFYYRDVIDFDFSAMYPSAMTAYNLFANCMIGKVIFMDDVSELLNYDDDAGKELIEDFVHDDPIWIGRKYLGLPSAEEILNELEELL